MDNTNTDAINPFQANAPFLYPLKTFSGGRKGTLARNGLNDTRASTGR